MADPHSPLLFGRVRRPVDRRALRQEAVRLRREVAQDRPFTCLVTTDKELRRLNREFLGHDYPTDVLSFPVAEAEEDSGLGEMAISLGRAAAQAEEHGHSVEDEVKILMLHGLLHLLGLDHETDGGRMARAERRWRQKLGYPTGLIERVRR